MGRFLFWLLLAWPTPALIAGALGWKGVWGSGSALADYLIPIPVAGGALHTLTFGCVTALLLTQKSWPPALRGLVRGILLGAAIAGLLLTFDVRGRLTENPLGLFLLSDGLIAQLFVGAFGGRWPAGTREWALSLLAACALPAAGAAYVLNPSDPMRKVNLIYSNDRAGPGRADKIHHVFTRLKTDSAEFKPAAVAYAQQWDPKYSVDVEDLAVYFFTSLDEARGNDDSKAAMTLCLYQDGTPPAWHGGRGDCFLQHETYADRVERFLGTLDPKLPLEDRLRLAKEKACGGVRLAQEHAVARLCSQKNK